MTSMCFAQFQEISDQMVHLVHIVKRRQMLRAHCKITLMKVSHEQRYTVGHVAVGDQSFCRLPQLTVGHKCQPSDGSPSNVCVSVVNPSKQSTFESR